jgi:hypothetical protein
VSVPTLRRVCDRVLRVSLGNQVLYAVPAALDLRLLHEQYATVPLSRLIFDRLQKPTRGARILAIVRGTFCLPPRIDFSYTTHLASRSSAATAYPD